MLFRSITFTEAGQHSVVVSQSVTYQNGRRTTTVNASIGLLAVTTGEATPGSQSHGGIVSSVINDKGELVITYEDGEAVNLGVVVGAQGATGPQGEKGDTGATGATGAQGEKGEKGDKGDKGDTGATGATGPQGEKGEKGDTGEAGADGSSGCSSSIGAVSTIAMISVLGFALAGYIAIKNLRKKEN